MPWLCVVDEDMAPGQDHIYVVFNLPALELGKLGSRALHTRGWGTDSAAASLMGLSGHSYPAKGEAYYKSLQLLPFHEMDR